MRKWLCYYESIIKLSCRYNTLIIYRWSMCIMIIYSKKSIGMCFLLIQTSSCGASHRFAIFSSLAAHVHSVYIAVICGRCEKWPKIYLLWQHFRSSIAHVNILSDTSHELWLSVNSLLNISIAHLSQYSDILTPLQFSFVVRLWTIKAMRPLRPCYHILCDAEDLLTGEIIKTGTRLRFVG